MASSLTELPGEIVDIVKEFISLEDQISWSCTNSSYRKLLAPSVFQVIRFNNEVTIAESALAAARKYGEHVTEIQFECDGKGNADEEFRLPDGAAEFIIGGHNLTGIQFECDGNPHEEGNNDESTLPEAARELLSGTHTPNVKSAQVHFLSCFEEVEWHEDLFFAEAEGTVSAEEERCNWRKLMRDTWSSVAQNPHVTRLVVKELMPKSTTAFSTAEFKSFLGRLDELEITFHGGDNSACLRSNTCDGYLAFIEATKHLLFDHTVALKRLSFASSPMAPIGLEGWFHVSLPIKSSQMPELECLELRTCFLGPDLIEFLEGHARSIKSLVLCDCYCCPDDLAENGMYWSGLLQGISRAVLSLSEFVVKGSNTPLCSQESKNENYNPVDEEPEVQAIRQAIKDDSNLKLFAYACLDDNYGLVYEMDDYNVAAFKRGEDQKAYEELIKVVQKNAENES